MSDALIIGLLAFFGSVFLAPIVTRTLATWAERHSKLSVEIEIFKFSLPLAMKGWINELMKDRWGDKTVPTQRLMEMQYCDCYLLLTVTNPGKKKISNVTLTPDFSCDYAIAASSELQKADKNNPIAVGDIQPKQLRQVMVWSGAQWWIYAPSSLKTMLKVSADELHGVRILMSVPPYLRYRYTIAPKWIGSTFSIIAPMFWMFVVPFGLIYLGARWWGISGK